MDASAQFAETVEEIAPAAKDGYSPFEHRPLRSYALLTGVFNAAFAGSLMASHRSGRELPERIGVTDIVLTGVATQKLSRLLSKDKVTSFVRAPFTRYTGDAGPGEVSEEPRGQGLRLAVGELVACPYCLGQWVAAAFMAGLVAAPRPTRMIAGTYTALALADFIQIAYAKAQEQL